MSLNPFQKVNHFPGTWNIGRKDMLFRNLQRMKRCYGSEEYYFVPQTFLLPGDWTLLCNELEHNKKPGVPPNIAHQNTYIIKPPASSCGKGIYLVNNAEDVEDPSQPAIAQRYIHNPLLINGYKVDLRLYASVVSFDPLRIYIYDEGLCRFATTKYKKGESHLKERFMHLTNYSVNKKSENFLKNTDADVDDVGSKWSITALQRYFIANNLPWDRVWSEIQDVLIKTVISIEAIVNSKIAMFVKYRNSCYELYGFDVMIDSDFKVYLIEINIVPSLHTCSPLDKKIKSMLVAEMFNLIGIQPYDRKEYAEQEEMRKRKRLLGFNSSTINEANSNVSSRCTVIPQPGNNLPITLGLSKNRKSIESLWKPDYLSDLSPEDKDIIRDHVDEVNRAGHFRCCFPTANTENKYSHLFEAPRFNNVLLCRWEQAMLSPNKIEFLQWLAQDENGPAPILHPSQWICPNYPVSMTKEISSSGREDKSSKTKRRNSASIPRTSAAFCSPAAINPTDKQTVNNRSSAGRRNTPPAPRMMKSATQIIPTVVGEKEGKDINSAIRSTRTVREARALQSYTSLEIPDVYNEVRTYDMVNAAGPIAQQNLSIFRGRIPVNVRTQNPRRAISLKH
eukprot:NODE_998_length_2193_cov_39.142029_g852_i0.p1 GENE.NODE_998_length_2193_cov_39.142029_g852_i0~~NODE_998_length_2193_cov_39.142029_g852_i0.p1  ORF type:complete len:651 (-),score=107.31 NODE_998_length_2193_cov_39.142029_g852_i0:239-2098(-)